MPAEVAVTVHAVELVAWTPPELEFRTTVSAGTYIRAIARDLGDRAGGRRPSDARCGGRRSAGCGWRRRCRSTRSGPRRCGSPARVLGHLPAVELDAGGRGPRSHGRAVPESAGEPGELARLMAGEELVAVARRERKGGQPVVVLGTP